MLIYSGIKAYKQKKEKKRLEEAGLDPNDMLNKPVCPHCKEEHKMEFSKRDDGTGQQATLAKCEKCGTEWRCK